jgi:AcrR family transcriptional regulator
MQTPTPKQNYHHGDLRSTLLEAALVTVEAEGVEALSFRQLARIAKVSPGAPYHHFRDKGELLAMVAKRGFETLHGELQRSSAAGVNPVNALHKLVHAYLKFARTSPKLYALLFAPEVTRPENLDLIEPDAMACFEQLQSALAAVDPSSKPAETHERALAVWGLLHGLVSLLIGSPLTRKLSTEADVDLAERSAMKLALD